jgi:formate hydrogenlyase subunit 4
MVIDLRKLNEMVIADEFPLPRQEDILQALSGSQWLTTLDALAGFTQLIMSMARQTSKYPVDNAEYEEARTDIMMARLGKD